MFALDVVSRVVHVLTAITLIGGSLFSLLVLIPVLKKLGEQQRQELHDSIVARWKRFVHFGVLLFLASGFYNYFQAIPNHKGDGQYHMLIGIKMLLAFVVFFLASALVGRSPALQKLRDSREKWLRVICLFGVIIVAISGTLKIRGVPAIEPTQQDTSEAE